MSNPLPDFPSVEFAPMDGGLTKIIASTPLGRVSILDQGAQILEWTPRDSPSVLYLSPDSPPRPGKSPRGGIPICWPWFGAAMPPLPQTAPAHGFARNQLWRLREISYPASRTLSLRFELPAAAQPDYWPTPVRLSLSIQIRESLEVELLTHNEADLSITITEALHTYFRVGDVRKTTVEGLQGTRFIDKLQDGTPAQQDGSVTIDREIDRIYLNTPHTLRINDPLLGRRILIEKSGSHSTVVWNPWIEKGLALGDLGTEGYLQMLCVESGNMDPAGIEIAPGDTHRLWVRYSHEPLLRGN